MGEASSSRRRTVLTMPPPPFSFQEESAFHSCSPSRNSLLRVTWVSSEVTSSSHPTEDPPFWTLRVEVPPPVMTLLLPSQPQVTPRSSRRKTQSPRRFLREALFLARPLSTAPLVRLLESLRASSHLIPTSEPRHQRILRSLACGMDSCAKLPRLLPRSTEKDPSQTK